MPLPPRINYSQLRQTFHQNLAGWYNKGQEFAGDSSQLSQAELIAFISSGMQQLENAQRRGSVFVSSDERSSSLLQTFLARKAASNPNHIVDTPSGPEVQFDSNDILGWAGSLFDWLKGLRKHEFIVQNDPPDSLKNSFRMALLSDWGTGMYGAPVCAQSIKTDGMFDLVMHLGDIYYSGDVDEVENRFLALWPRLDGAINLALNSNHEMYSGGHGYFKKILPAFNQKASYFAYQNDYWLLVGLDTGYQDHDLYGNQSEWLLNLVRTEENRKVILFSHHQPYSLFESQGENLLAKLAKLLDQQKIFAWYWGHEHRCALYDKHPIWGMYGRCIGHGGFPYFRDDFRDMTLDKPGWIRHEGKNLIPGCYVLDGPNPYVPENPDRYGPNGYVGLEFNDRELVEVICNADGTKLRTTPLA